MQLLARNKSLLLSCLIVLVASCPSLLGLFHTGFFVSDDGNWMVIRFSAFYEALRHGQFPVRFLPRLLNGYGYPVADFLYPLFMYLGVLIHIVGINFVTTVKILFGLSMLGSGMFTFLWLRRFFPTFAAVVGAVTFVYFPYHMFDLYVRGSMGEILALCIVPFILWQIERKSIPIAAIGIGLLIMSHNSLAVLFLPVILVYYFMRQRSIFAVFLSTLFGIGIATFFWLPALYDQQFTVFQTRQVANFSQYFLDNSHWYLFGIEGLIALIIGLGSIIKNQKLAGAFSILLLVSVFLSLPISEFVWNILPLGKYIQFPFRFLSLSIVAASFLIAYGVSILKKQYQLMFSLGISTIVILSSWMLLPQKYQMYPDSWYSTNQDSTTVQNEYLPKWVKEIPTSKTSVAQITKGEGHLKLSVQQGSYIFIQTENKSSIALQINTIYFPGWEVLIDHKPQDNVYQNENGLMTILVPPGRHTITGAFKETPLRILADVVSLLSLICLGIYTLIQYKKR